MQAAGAGCCRLLQADVGTEAAAAASGAAGGRRSSSCSRARGPALLLGHSPPQRAADADHGRATCDSTTHNSNSTAGVGGAGSSRDSSGGAE